jgi:hypothetical protein
MARFVEIEGRYINVDNIVSIVNCGKTVTIWHSSGDCRQVSTSYVDEIIGRNHVVTLVPVDKPIRAYYGDGSIFCDVSYLALAASGEMRPVGFFGGRYDFLDKFKEFKELRCDTSIIK